MKPLTFAATAALIIWLPVHVGAALSAILIAGYLVYCAASVDRS